jgi:phosphate starvation-inducible PhoH-like protein
VAVGDGIGFLKGDLREKTEPWALPVLDVLEEHLGKGTVDTGIKNGNIEIAPMAMMRGRSFKDAFIIVDESQNISFDQLKMLLTRVGEGSKIILNGDIMQSDLKGTDGLTIILGYIEKYDLPVPIIEFGVDDIVRSALTKMWVEVFLKEKV